MGNGSEQGWLLTYRLSGDLILLKKERESPAEEADTMDQ